MRLLCCLFELLSSFIIVLSMSAGMSSFRLLYQSRIFSSLPFRIVAKSRHGFEQCAVCISGVGRHKQAYHPGILSTTVISFRRAETLWERRYCTSVKWTALGHRWSRIRYSYRLLIFGWRYSVGITLRLVNATSGVERNDTDRQHSNDKYRKTHTERQIQRSRSTGEQRGELSAAGPVPECQ